MASTPLGMALCVATLPACGLLKAGSGSPNDPEPQGAIKAQATFESRNSKSVSGGVTVYRLESGSFVVRLNGISVPSEAGLALRVTADNATVLNSALRASSGSQNYPAAPSSADPVWNKAVIRSNASNLDYGEAQF